MVVALSQVTYTDSLTLCCVLWNRQSKTNSSSILFNHKNYNISKPLLLIFLLLFLIPFLLFLLSLPTPDGVHPPIQQLAALRTVNNMRTPLKQAMNIKPPKTQIYSAHEQAFSNSIALGALLPLRVCGGVRDRLSSGGHTIFLLLILKFKI